MMTTDEEIAEGIARFHTPPGFNRKPLRDDILTVLKTRREEINRLEELWLEADATLRALDSNA
jgi:hypothetical protein